MPVTNFREVIAESSRIFLVGVAGDSGSGKTTMTRAIREIFGPSLVASISLDDYHRYGREERRALGITPLHPDANRIDAIEEDLRKIRQGISIEKPVYNHREGRIDPSLPFIPGKIVLIEGLHALFTQAIRESLDFGIFVEPDKDVRYEWKLRRDVNHRGYDSREVVSEMAARESDYERYIRPQADYADAVVRIRHSKYGADLGHARNVYQVVLSQVRMRHSIEEIDLMLDIYSLLSLSERNFLLEFIQADHGGRMMGDLLIDGEMSGHTIARLEGGIERQTGVHPIALFRSADYVTAIDIARLLLAWRIIHRRIYVEYYARPPER